jgi:exonuclease SbcD
MIKVIHTSDWHLGQRFFGESREKEHKAFLDWLIQVINRDDIDILIISGDIFDTKNPPSYARRIYNDFLAKAIESKCKNIVVIAGNHDSKIVLNEQKNLLDNFGIFTVGDVTGNIRDLIFEIKRDNKLVGIVSAIPYLSETELRDSRKSTSESSRAKALEENIKKCYNSAYKLSKQIAKNNNIPIVATGHLSTLSRYSSEATREIYIGTLGLFNQNNFPPFNYIALGHYHKKIISNNIAYSGSPIALSFDEVNYKKYILEVEISESRLDIKEIQVPRYRDIFTIRGTISNIEKKLKDIQIDSKIKPAFIELKVIKAKNIEDINSRIDKLYKIKNIKIVKVTIEDKNSNIGLNNIEELETLEDINPKKVFLKRLELEKFNEKSIKKLLDKFIEIQNRVELDEN